MYWDGAHGSSTSLEMIWTTSGIVLKPGIFYADNPSDVSKEAFIACYDKGPKADLDQLIRPRDSKDLLVTPANYSDLMQLPSTKDFVKGEWSHSQ